MDERGRIKGITGAWLRFADAWLPRDCALCDCRLSQGEAGLCELCITALPGGRAPRCRCCGLRGQYPGSGCPACASDPPPFDRTVVLADYAAPLDALVRALKFRGEFALGGALGQCLAPRLLAADARIEALVPVPLAPARLAGRGFNQSSAIARGAARATGLPMAPELLWRCRETPAQSTLTLAQRQTNLESALRAHPRAAGRCLAVVDDVMTSGATLRAAARALKTAGARSVVNLVAARTP